MGSGGSGSKKAPSTVVQNVNRPGTHGPRPRGTIVLRKKQQKGIYELSRNYWNHVPHCMAHAHLYVLCKCNVGIFGCWRNYVSYWNIARLLFVVFMNGRGYEICPANVACAGDGQRSLAASCGCIRKRIGVYICGSTY